MAVIFNSKQTCDLWLEKHKELSIDDSPPVRVSPYLKKEIASNALRRKQNIEKRQKEKADGKKEEKGQHSSFLLLSYWIAEQHFVACSNYL